MPATYSAGQAAAYLKPCSEEGHAGPFLVCVQPNCLHQCLLHHTQGLALLVLSHTYVPAIVLAQHDLPGTWELAEQRPSIVHDIRRNCNALHSNTLVT